MSYVSAAQNISSNTLTFINPGAGAQNPFPDRVQIQNNSQYAITENVDSTIIGPNVAITIPCPTGQYELIISVISYIVSTGTIGLEWLLPGEKPKQEDGPLQPAQGVPINVQPISSSNISFGTNTAALSLPLQATGLFIQCNVGLIDASNFSTDIPLPIYSIGDQLYYIPYISTGAINPVVILLASGHPSLFNAWATLNDINPFGDLILPAGDQSLIVTNPAAGADWAYSVAGGLGNIRIKAIHARLTTSAVAANRYPLLALPTLCPSGDTIPVISIFSQVAVTASNIYVFNLFPGAPSIEQIPGAGLSIQLNNAIPNLTLVPGDVITSYTYNLQSGDQWSNIAIIYSQLGG